MQMTKCNAFMCYLVEDWLKKYIKKGGLSESRRCSQAIIFTVLKNEFLNQ